MVFGASLGRRGLPSQQFLDGPKTIYSKPQCTALDPRYAHQVVGNIHRVLGRTSWTRVPQPHFVGKLGDGGSNQVSGDLQPGSRPEPEIKGFGGFSRAGRPPNLLKKVGGGAHHFFGSRLDAQHR